jgi:L-ascorbate metabolism protein UlaG (beta-lactamase superfamily)
MRTLRVSVCLVVMWAAGAGAATDSIPARGGPIRITPILHSTLQIEYGGKVIQVDPWSLGDPSLTKPADLILVSACCDLHHIDPAAIRKLRKPGAPVIIPDVAGARERFAEGTVLPNGQVTTAAGIRVESVASYDAYIKLDPFHPKGEGNGYLLTLGDKRLFLAGVTECVPEIQALENIDIAFLPLNLPVGRMTPAKAAECARTLKAPIVYPYHFDNARSRLMENPKARNASEAESTANQAGVQEFRRLLAPDGITVRIGAFYPENSNKP